MPSDWRRPVITNVSELFVSKHTPGAQTVRESMSTQTTSVSELFVQTFSVSKLLAQTTNVS